MNHLHSASVLNVLAIVLVLSPAPVLAEADPAFVEVLDICMNGPTDQAGPRSCIGILTTQCTDKPEGQSTAGMVNCTYAEANAWDVLLNREYQTARAFALDADANDSPVYAVRAETLRDAQRAWIAFRDANCAAEYAAWGAGTIRQVIGASCHLQMTAERTLDLRAYYEVVR